MSYVAPMKDLRFALEHCAGFWRLDANFPDLDAGVLEAVLEGGAALAGDVLAPLNTTGDRQGLKLVGDAVTTPAGFDQAYAQFLEGGWQGLSADPQFGGQGLPRALTLAVHEMLQGANMAFVLCPMLTLGAIEALSTHGDEAQRRDVLPHLVSGAWTGTMNLTEPHAGSDVGALTTKAIPLGDGRYALHGQKIFITWGEHGLARNIAHLVLARLPDAPAGSRGVSLFLALRNHVEPDGAIGQRNGLRCIGLEHKLGIHASPTCTMAFEGAQASLIGAPNQGLAAMFTMMNSARLHVGMQGVAIAEAAYQKALAFAKERRQGRAEGQVSHVPSPIIAHADVRRMLMGMKARIAAARAICLETAVQADLAHGAADSQMRSRAKAREDLLTPIAKAWCTDMGVEVSSMGVQIHGGMGFVEEGGAAQFYRDARIAPIYEGTNGIQAIDLVGRKLAGDGGEAMRQALLESRQAGAQLVDSGDARLGRFGARLQAGCAALEHATEYILDQAKADRRAMLAGAAPFLQLAGDVVGGTLLAKGALSARAAQAGEGHQIGAIAAFYGEAVLARAPSHLPAIEMGSAALFEDGLAEFDA